jgi:putative addiction module killer protein/probable addiction module antidote protein
VSYEVLKTAAFDGWLESLTDTVAQDAILDRISRVESGLLGDRRSVGDKVSELRIDVGQGYRLYFTLRAQTSVLLLCGGSKKSQKADIRKAAAMVKSMKKGRAASSDSRVRDRQATYGAQGDDDEEFHFTEEELQVSRFDAAKYLARESSQLHLLRSALADGHPGHIANVIGIVARARGLTAIERETGIKRQTLNKSLSPKGNPTLETLLTVLGALGLKLEIVEDRPGRRADPPASRTA